MPETLPALLPASRTPWETAQSLTGAARRPLPTGLVKAVWNPATCPADLLPYLAAGLGLELWRDAWPEAKKRAVIADIWRLKRNKTKLKGIRDYLDLVDAGLVKAVTPKSKMWLVRTQTDAERAAAMATMPQIHIATRVAPIAASLPKLFLAGGREGQFWSRSALVPSDAPARWAARATYVDRGTATPVFVRGIDGTLDAGVTVEMSAAASTAKAFLSGRDVRQFWRAGRCWQASDADARVLAITPSAGAAAFAVPAGLVPTTVRPVRVAEPAPAQTGQLILGRSAWGRGAWRVSNAEAHVFDQVTLFDPARMRGTRRPVSFWGYSRFGQPKFTAELTVDVTLQRPAFGFAFGRPWGRGFWHRNDMTPFWDALGAIRAAKAFRDQVWVSTELRSPIQFSAGLRFGDFTNFGDTRRVA